MHRPTSCAPISRLMTQIVSVHLLHFESEMVNPPLKLEGFQHSSLSFQTGATQKKGWDKYLCRIEDAVSQGLLPDPSQALMAASHAKHVVPPNTLTHIPTYLRDRPLTHPPTHLPTGPRLLYSLTQLLTYQAKVTKFTHSLTYHADCRTHICWDLGPRASVRSSRS